MFTSAQEKILNKLGLTKSDFCSIFGGKKLIEQEKLTPWFKEDAPEGVVVKMSNGKKSADDNFVIVYIFSKNNLEIFIDGFYLPHYLRGKGIATKCLTNLMKVANKIDRPLLVAKCGRNDEEDEIGYVIRPRLGFNGLVKSKQVELLKNRYCKEKNLTGVVKKKIIEAEDIIDLCSFEEGKACWKEIGWTFEGEFDLQKNSKSMKTFNKHLKKYK